MVIWEGKQNQKWGGKRRMLSNWGGHGMVQTLGPGRKVPWARKMGLERQQAHILNIHKGHVKNFSSILTGDRGHRSL